MKKFMTKYFGDRHFYKEVLIVAVPLMPLRQCLCLP